MFSNGSNLDGEVYAGLLVLVNLSVLQLGLALLLEGDDDQGHKDVDKEEGEDNEEDDVEDGHLCPEKRSGSDVLKRGTHRVLQHPDIGQQS